MINYDLSNYKHLAFIDILEVKSFHTEKMSWGNVHYSFSGIAINKVIKVSPEFIEKLSTFNLPSSTNVMSFDPKYDEEIMLLLNNILKINGFFYDPTWNYQINWVNDIIIFNKEESSYELLTRVY